MENPSDNKENFQLLQPQEIGLQLVAYPITIVNSKQTFQDF